MKTIKEIRETVRARYGEIASISGTCCSGPSCGVPTNQDPSELSLRNGYTEEELRTMLEDAGFTDIRITRKGESRDILENWFPGRGVADFVASANIEARKP